jgi:hypothetical protein
MRLGTREKKRDELPFPLGGRRTKSTKNNTQHPHKAMKRLTRMMKGKNNDD